MTTSNDSIIRLSALASVCLLGSACASAPVSAENTLCPLDQAVALQVT